MRAPSRPVQKSVYRVLLRLYPGSFRREYGGLMAQAFSDRLRERGARSTWLSIAGDLSLSVPQQALRETVMSQRWLAEVSALITVAMVTAVWVGAGSPLLLVGAGVVFIPLLGLWSAKLSSPRAESVPTVVGPKRWTWWTALAGGVGGLYVLAAAVQAVSDPKATNLGALVFIAGFAALIRRGLILRSRSRMVGNWMVMIGMVPALLFFWVVVPALAAVAVIWAASREISSRAR